ncbi:hypothetical protein HELRODRAFT_184670 [Helobdella robusta]|uniref:DUF659 domain-containing protein n=1 Tax=Helobdella robusta TaxID=6412 RepID=T1FLQ7_HELRO|nr:hypothetical protein HELRODRAFT_184670 [Helobdella robusta]ESO07052.1 hypothetical protein HELRODRAFT_184670 [Helobdella robusta]
MGTSVSKKFNLWRHVKRNHPKIYDELVKQKDENDKAASDKKRGNENDATPSKKKIKTVQENMSTYFTSSKVTITMDASTFQEGLVEMICLSMVPFTSFTLKNKGFQKIVGEMAKKLGVSMGHDAVRHLVITTADSSRMKLRQTLREQLCYLKLDAATRGNKNYLAINLQFYNETSNKSEIKTLDIVDTEGNHNSLYVKNQIKETLKKFDIEEKQILSICVDNAANMTSAVNKLGIRESITQGEGNEEPEDIDENSANILQQWVNDPSEILPQWVNEDTNIQLMRCGIHTLQLAIWDGLKNERNNVIFDNYISNSSKQNYNFFSETMAHSSATIFQTLH